MRCLRLLIALGFLGLTTGCEVNRILTIKPDGSGQISDRFMAGRDAYGGEAKPTPPDGSPTNTMPMGLPQPTAEYAAKQGAEYGEGVKLVEYRRVETKEALGYEAVYTFPDVSKIRADKFDMGDAEMPGVGKSDKETAARYFQFTKGSPSELRVATPPKSKEAVAKASPTPGPAAGDPVQEAAALAMLRHTNVRVAIRVEGSIVETNARFRKGNEVIVREMNLEGMMSDPKYIKIFTEAVLAGKTSPSDLPPAEEYIKEEPADVLSIQFK